MRSPMGWYKNRLVEAFSPSKSSQAYCYLVPGFGFRGNTTKTSTSSPRPLQVLELPGGAHPGYAHAHQGTAPPPARKYVGKMLAAVTIADASQLKKSVKP